MFYVRFTTARSIRIMCSLDDLYESAGGPIDSFQRRLALLLDVPAGVAYAGTVGGGITRENLRDAARIMSAVGS